MSNNIGTMLEELWEREVNLQHAVIVTDTVESNGSRLREVHHYLTCVKCRLRALLDLPREEIDNNGRVVKGKIEDAKLVQ